MTPVTTTVARGEPTTYLDIDRAVEDGRHVHSIGSAGEWCESGHCRPDDPLPLEGVDGR